MNLKRSKETSRKSGVELLRLLCMYLILLEHALGHGYHNLNLPGGIHVSDFLFSFCVCAVNTFVLISGYFGLQLKLKSFYKLFSSCAFYGLLGYVIHLFVDGQHIGRSLLTNGVFVFSNPPGWWFIKQYVFLLLLSPILNYAVESMNRERFRLALVILLILSLYFGLLWHDPVNSSGYCLMQFVFLYFIGRYMKIYSVSCRSSLRSFVGYVVCGILLFVLFFVGKILSSDFPLFDYGHYNHPLVILAAVFLFQSFNLLQISSKSVNCMSSSALAVYLITENNYIKGWYYSLLLKLVGPLDGFNRYLLLLLVLLLVLCFCITVDKVRLFFCRPMDKAAERFCEKWQQSIPA